MICRATWLNVEYLNTEGECFFRGSLLENIIRVSTFIHRCVRGMSTSCASN